MSEEKVVVAYKAMKKDFTCRGFQFRVGETYEHQGKVAACKSGFHACENPLDMWSYYDLTDSKFCSVELSGELARHGDDSKIAAGRIMIKAEIGLPQIITGAVRWIMDLCKNVKEGEEVQSASGDSSQLAASGDSSQLAASGYYSKLAASGYSSQLAASGYSSKLAASGYSSQLAASGDSSQLAASGDSSQLAASGDSSQLAASGDSSQLAASGDSSQLAASGDSSQLAASGDSSQLAASGDYSKLAASGDSSQLAASGYSSQLAASGNKSIVMAAATDCTATVGEDGCIALAWWDSKTERFRVAVGYAGEDGIEANVAYCVRDGKLARADDGEEGE